MSIAEPISTTPNPPIQSTPEIADAWVLVWSHSQNSTHVEPLSRMLESNRRAYTNNTPMDYVPLYIGHREEAFAMSRSLRQTLMERENERSPRLVQLLGLRGAH